MAKWADYLISEVTYDSNHLILKIKQHTDNGKTISQGDIVDRDILVKNLGRGAKYMTLYNSLEKVRIGKTVKYFRAYEHHYIRIDKNKVATDNLGDLPDIEKSNYVEKPALPPTKPTVETKPLSTINSTFFAEPVEETVEPVEEIFEEVKKSKITKRKAPVKKKKAPVKKRKR